MIFGIRIAMSVTIILGSTGANAAIGFSPIPFSDWPVLLAVECGMILSLMTVWGLKNVLGFEKGETKKNVKKLIGMVTGAIAGGGSILGGLVGGKIITALLKFVPGVGTLIAGVIDGGIATVLTFLVGISVVVSFSSIDQMLHDKNLEDKNAEYWEKQFEEIFNKKFKQISNSNVTYIYSLANREKMEEFIKENAKED